MISSRPHSEFGAFLVLAIVSMQPAILDAARFVRGDANQNGRLELGDPVIVLDGLFRGATIPCEAAGDANADDHLDLSDAVSLLDYLFRGGTAPESPFPACGESEQSLSCADDRGCPQGVAIPERVSLGVGMPSRVAYSADGERFALGGESGAMSIFDGRGGGFVKSIFGHTDRVNSLEFDAGDTLLVTASTDTTARVWDVASGRDIEIYEHSLRASAAVLSPNGQRLYTTGDEGIVFIWDRSTGDVITTYERDSSQGFGFVALDVSSDDRWLLVASQATALYLLDLTSGEFLERANPGRGRAVLFHPDGERYAAAGDFRFVISDIEGTGELFTIREDADALAFDANGALMARNNKATIYMHDFDSREVVKTLTPHTDDVRSLALSPDGRQLVTAGADHASFLLDVDSGDVLESYSGHSGEVFAVDASDSGDLVLTASLDGSMRLWDAARAREVRVLLERSPLRCARFSGDGEHILSGGSDRVAKLWTATGTLVRTFPDHDHWVTSVAFAGDGRSAATGTARGTLRLLDIDSGAVQGPFDLGAGSLNELVFAPDGARVVAAAASGGRVVVFDIPTSKVERVLEDVHLGAVNAVDISPDGITIATVGGDSSVRLWSIESGERLAELDGGFRWGTAVAFSPGGARLASAGDDGAIRIWDVAGRAVLETLRGHNGAVNDLVFTSSGSHVISGGRDATARAWRLDRDD